MEKNGILGIKLLPDAMFKTLYRLILFAAAATVVWFGLALWAGAYSIYSVPPSKDDPDGSTRIVKRQEGEPLFNSPDYVPPPAVKQPEDRSAFRFSTAPKQKRTVEERTIVAFPFIAWAYRQSLDKPAPDRRAR